MLAATCARKRAESSTVASASFSNWAVCLADAGKLVPQDFGGDPLVSLGRYWNRKCRSTRCQRTRKGNTHSNLSRLRISNRGHEVIA